MDEEDKKGPEMRQGKGRATRCSWWRLNVEAERELAGHRSIVLNDQRCGDVQRG